MTILLCGSEGQLGKSILMYSKNQEKIIEKELLNSTV